MRQLPNRPRIVRPRRHPRGQGMTEYIVVVFFALVLLMAPIPGPNQNVIELFLNAYKTYYDSFYFVLNLPLP